MICPSICRSPLKVHRLLRAKKPRALLTGLFKPSMGVEQGSMVMVRLRCAPCMCPAIAAVEGVRGGGGGCVCISALPIIALAGGGAASIIIGALLFKQYSYNTTHRSQHSGPDSRRPGDVLRALVRSLLEFTPNELIQCRIRNQVLKPKLCVESLIPLRKIESPFSESSSPSLTRFFFFLQV